MRLYLVLGILLFSWSVFAKDCDMGLYSMGKEQAQKAAGYFNSCLDDKKIPANSKVSLKQVQLYDQKCGGTRASPLNITHDLNYAFEDGFWQDIASKSYFQSKCRKEFLENYEKDSSLKKNLNDKIEAAFNQHKDDLEYLGEYRASVAKDLKEWQNANNSSGRGLFKERVDGYEKLLKGIDQQIAKVLAKIPMGYEPEIGTRLVAMAMTGSFHSKSLEAGMKQAQIKYANSEIFYIDKMDKKDQNFCLDVNFKNEAVQSGQAAMLINSYDYLNAKDKAILQCRVESVYETGARRVNKVTTGLILGGAILAAIPTEGTSLGLAIGALGLTSSALGFMEPLNDIRQKCSLSTFIISGQAGQCNPQQEFNNITQTNTLNACLGSFAMASVGAIAIPASIRKIVDANRAMRLSRSSAQVGADSPTAVSSSGTVARAEDEIVVTASKKKTKPQVGKKKIAVSRSDAAPVSATAAPAPLNRKQFTSENLNKGVTTEKQNIRWNEIAEETPPPVGLKFLDTENAAVKALNDKLLDKNFVTAMTNKHKQLVMDRVKTLEAKYPDVEFLPYSDFKSFRYAFRPKPPSKELPRDLYSDVNKAFEGANKELAEILKNNGLIDKFSDSKDWFKAGFDETADGASDLSRWSRNAPDTNHVRTRTGTYVEARETDIKMTELYRGSLQSSLKGSPLLEESSVAGQFIPRDEIFDAVRKTSSAEDTQKFIKWNTGEEISLVDANKLRKYSEMTDTFSPSLRIAKREMSVLNGTHGGITIDLVGAGSKNLKKTADATVGAKNLDEVLARARTGEKEVTAILDAKKLEVRETVMPILKKNGVEANFMASGDDISIVPLNKPLSDQVKKEIADALAATKDPSSFRMGIVGPRIPTTTDRMILATTMEDVVKKTMINVKVPPEVRKQVFISAHTDATAVGKGKVKLLIGGDVSPAIRKQYEEAFEQAIIDINKKTKSNYRH